MSNTDEISCTTGGNLQADPATMQRFLDLLTWPPVGCVELRVLRAVADRRGRIVAGDHGLGWTFAGWFNDPGRLVQQADRLRGVSGYVSINPVHPDLLGRCDNRLARVRRTTRDAEILCLRWLYLDLDPVRPPEISSTDLELSAAVRRRDAILADHPELANSALWGRSGNGCWVLVRLPDYPNDSTHVSLIRDTVQELSRVYSDDLVRLDTATVNPSRLIGLPGTIKAKGSPRPERPWRAATLDGVGRGAPAVPSDGCHHANR